MEAATRAARVRKIALVVVLWTIVVVVGTAVLTAVLQPRWVELCARFSNGSQPCGPTPRPRIAAYALVVLGLAVAVLGPVLTSLWDLMRNGYNWEQSRVEPAFVNGPILYGMAMVLVAFVMVFVT